MCHEQIYAYLQRQERIKFYPPLTTSVRCEGFTKDKRWRNTIQLLPITAHAQNFDLLTGCREFKRMGSKMA